MIEEKIETFEKVLGEKMPKKVDMGSVADRIIKILNVYGIKARDLKKKDTVKFYIYKNASIRFINMKHTIEYSFYFDIDGNKYLEVSFATQKDKDNTAVSITLFVNAKVITYNLYTERYLIKDLYEATVAKIIGEECFFSLDEVKSNA